jgi:hypothetical protein
VPTTDSCTAAKNLYSITSLARASRERGYVMPSAFAVCSALFNILFTRRSATQQTPAETRAASQTATTF